MNWFGEFRSSLYKSNSKVKKNITNNHLTSVQGITETIRRFLAQSLKFPNNQLHMFCFYIRISTFYTCISEVFRHVSYDCVLFIVSYSVFLSRRAMTF